MGAYIGRLAEVGIEKEASRGAGAASPGHWLPKVDFSFDDKKVVARVVGSLGKLADSEEAFNVVRFGAGDMIMDLRSQAIGYFLYSLLGTLSTSGPTDSAYTHAFTIDEDNQHQSLVLFVKDPNTTEAYKLVVVNTLEIVAALDETVKANINFLSKKGNTWGSLTPSYTDESMFVRKHVKVKVAAAIGDLAAASQLSIRNLRLTMGQNAVRDDVLGTVEPEDIFNQQISVEGELTLRYDSETWKQYFTTPTDRAMEIKFENDDETIGAGATNPSLTIQLPKVDFFGWDPDYTLDEIVTQTLSFKANYDIANTQNIIHLCSLVNGKTSY